VCVCVCVWGDVEFRSVSAHLRLVHKMWIKGIWEQGTTENI